MSGTVTLGSRIFALSFKRSPKVDHRQSHTLIVDDHGVVHVVGLDPGKSSRLISRFDAITHEPDIHVSQVHFAALLDRLKCGVGKTSAGDIMQKPWQAMRIDGSEGTGRMEVGVAVLVSV